MITVSQQLQFYASNEEFKHERRVVLSANFNGMRRRLGNCIRRLKEADEYDAIEKADKIRALLSTCLTSPVDFDETLFDAIGVIGREEELERRWGLGGELHAAKDYANSMTQEGSPLRKELCAIISKYLEQGKNIKIICHKKAKAYFTSLLSHAHLSSTCTIDFIHSSNDYASANLFDILIKVGPLRSLGWGAIPDAVKNSPKYKLLIQFIWAGSEDDSEYGYDPARTILLNETLCKKENQKTQGSHIKWQIDNFLPDIYVTNTNQYLLESEEQLLLPDEDYENERRSALLIQTSPDKGLLSSPEGVLSFDPNSTDPESVALRSPFEALRKQMYYIKVEIDNQAFVQVIGEEGRYSRVWKERLRNELRIAPDSICLILKNKGINLQGLRARVESWSVAPTAVIHAPMRRSHFKILIEALAIDLKILNENISDDRQWWERAWDEVRSSRGEAIQTGRKESVLIHEQTIETLRAMTTEIRERTNNGDNACIRSLQGLKGVFRFFKIIDVDEGFAAPSSEIGLISDLSSLDKWRVN